MNINQLLCSTELAVSGLLTDKVLAVAVGWDEARLCLTLRYYFSDEPTGEEKEMCSCALAELEAEFSPYIENAKDEWICSAKKLDELDPLSGWGYVKR